MALGDIRQSPIRRVMVRIGSRGRVKVSRVPTSPISDCTPMISETTDFVWVIKLIT